MNHLKVTSHVFLYDSVAAASLGQTTIYPVHESRGQNDRRLYVSPFAGLQAVSTAPMITQTLRRVSPEITTAKHKNGRLATDRRTPKGGGRRVSVYIPAMIRARKGPMTALRPLMANQPMQPVTLEPTRSTVIHRPALPVLPRIHKAAVHGLARTREQEHTGGHAEVAHGGLWDVRLEPGGVPDVRLHELSSVFGR